MHIKKFILLLTVLLVGSLAWMGFVREPLQLVPDICAEISAEVKLDFSINTMDYTGIELSLNNGKSGKGMYVAFSMSNAWKTGRPGLVLNGIKPSSALKNSMSPGQYLKDDKRGGKSGKDFSSLLKDKGGKTVDTYSFRQTLVEDKSGKTFIQMSYDGPAVEMLQILEILRPVTVPAHVSQQFTSKGNIQFQSGTVSFDPKISDFYIPVVIRG